MVINKTIVKLILSPYFTYQRKYKRKQTIESELLKSKVGSLKQQQKLNNSRYRQKHYRWAASKNSFIAQHSQVPIVYES